MNKRIEKLKEELGLPTDDAEWHYVWVLPIRIDGYFTIRPIVKWLAEQRIYYWEFKWKDELRYGKWRESKKTETLYPDRDVCFRFSNPDHATLFKMVWG